MGDFTWRDEIINKVEKWPNTFRARLRDGVWRLLGADQNVRDEFTWCAGQIQRQLHLPRGNTSSADAVLYWLRQQGLHVQLSQVHRKRRVSSVKVESNRAFATVSPLRDALVNYVRQAVCPDLQATPESQTLPRSSGRAAMVERNRERQCRVSIIRALQRVGAVDYAKWPDFVRMFHTDSQERAFCRQPISPPPFQPASFDPLNQSWAEWKKNADTAWLKHCDRFRHALAFWITAGVDAEVPEGIHACRSARKGVESARGKNAAVEQRFEWAAKYLLGRRVKEIAAHDCADPSTVGRVARAVLRQAKWLESVRAAKINDRKLRSTKPA